MIILAIDPGTVSVGYAVLETTRPPALLCAGLLRIGSDARDRRLKELHQELRTIIRRHRPAILAVEKLFFAKNQKTALGVAEARGVILLTAALADLTVYEYTPLEIKSTITGDGTADKQRIRKMVLLTMPELKGLRARDDVFDAIAIALTCFYKERVRY